MLHQLLNARFDCCQRCDTTPSITALECTSTIGLRLLNRRTQQIENYLPALRLACHRNILQELMMVSCQNFTCQQTRQSPIRTQYLEFVHHTGVDQNLQQLDQSTDFLQCHLGTRTESTGNACLKKDAASRTCQDELCQ